MNDKIWLEDVRRLELQAGDTLVITIAGSMPPEAWEQAADVIKEWHPGVHVLIVPPETGIDVVRSDPQAQEGGVHPPRSGR